MKNQKLYHTLITLSPLELKAKDYYEKTHSLYTREELDKLIGEGDYSQWGFRKSGIPRLQEENFGNQMLQLLESDFFNEILYANTYKKYLLF